MEISEQTVLAYQWAEYHRKQVDPKTGLSDKPLSVRLADALRDVLAELRKAEFWKEHHLWKSACGAMHGAVVDGVMQACTRPEHDWTADQWREAAGRELMGEKWSR